MTKCLPFAVCCLASLVACSSVFGDESQGQCEECPDACPATAASCQQECGTTCSQGANSSAILSGVVIADAEALLGGLSLSGAVVFGTLPSDRLLEIADASATASETQPCCAEASCCVDPATVQPASPIARQILALRQSLAATSDCVLKFDSEAFVVYVGHGNAEVPSEASIILTTCANPAGEVDAALIDRPAVPRSTTLIGGLRFDGMRFDGSAVVGPNVIGTQEAAALRFAADRRDEAAAAILPVAGDEQPIAQPLRIAQPATDTLLR